MALEAGADHNRRPDGSAATAAGNRLIIGAQMPRLLISSQGSNAMPRLGREIAASEKEQLQTERDWEAAYEKLVRKLARHVTQLEDLGENDMGILHHSHAA